MLERISDEKGFTNPIKHNRSVTHLDYCILLFLWIYCGYYKTFYGRYLV